MKFSNSAAPKEIKENIRRLTPVRACSKVKPKAVARVLAKKTKLPMHTVSFIALAAMFVMPKAKSALATIVIRKLTGWILIDYPSGLKDGGESATNLNTSATFSAKSHLGIPGIQT